MVWVKRQRFKVTAINTWLLVGDDDGRGFVIERQSLLNNLSTGKRLFELDAPDPNAGFLVSV